MTYSCNVVPEQIRAAFHFPNVLSSPASSKEHREHNATLIELETEAEERVFNSRPVFAHEMISRGSAFIERGAEPSTYRTRREQNPMAQENVQPSSHLISEHALRSSTELYGGLEEFRGRLRESDAQRAGLEAQSPSTAGQSITGPRQSVDFSEELSEPNQAHQTPIVASLNNPTNQAPTVLSDQLSTFLINFSQDIDRRLKYNKKNGGYQIETPRLMLLREAIQNSDIFYVMLHQIYCLDSFPQMPEAVVRYGFKPIHSQGLRLLIHLLGENDKMRPATLRWFATMPSSFGRMIQVSRLTVSEIWTFLERVSNCWMQVKNETKLRECPPSPGEMTVYLGLQSLVLQTVLFRAFLREIWSGAQDHCFNHCEKVFQLYQTAPSSRLTVLENQNFYDEISRARAQHQVHSHRSECQQLVVSQNEVLPMAPPQRRFSDATASSGHVIQFQGRAFQSGTRNRPASISTHAPQQISSVSSEIYMPTASSSTSDYVPITPTEYSGIRQQHPRFQERAFQADTCNGSARIITNASQQISSVSPEVYMQTAPSSTFDYVPITPTQYSRIPQQHLPDDQGFRIVTPLFTNLPSAQSSTMRVSTQGSNSWTTTSASSSWCGDQQRRAADATLSEKQPENYTGPNRGSHPQIPQTSIMISTQVPASLRDTVQASGHRHINQSNSQLSSSQDNLASSTNFGSIANSQTDRPSTLSDLGRPFPRPLSTFPESTTDHSAINGYHATSPTLRVINTFPSTEERQYFMYLERVELCPEQLHARKRYVKWTVDLRHDDIKMLAKTIETSVGYPSQLIAAIGSCLCRIRCVKVQNLATSFTESDWVAASNAWPSGIAILLNGKALEIRKKLHHSKDLPINITSSLQEGRNSISVAVSTIDDGSVYGLAMETAQVTDTRSIKKLVSRLNWSEAKDTLLRNLNNMDSDAQVLDPKMILDLTDPLTSEICCLPVRGKACKHKQCFDLDNFLLTRNGKTNEPCGPDQFRCPICGADARPKNLLIDGFFVKVREELQQLGRLDVKAIVLEENGDWRIKEEEQIGEPGDGTE